MEMFEKIKTYRCNTVLNCHHNIILDRLRYHCLNCLGTDVQFVSVRLLKIVKVILKLQLMCIVYGLLVYCVVVQY